MSPVMFVLIVDNFGIKYVCDNHLHHLRTVPTDHYTITQDIDGKLFAGVDLNWNYSKDHAQRTCRLSMDGYTDNLILTFGHKAPSKPQISPHRHHKFVYGSNHHLVVEEDTSPKITKAGIKRVQAIVGELLYYARAVNNKLLVGLGAIVAQQSAATKKPHAVIDQLLDHVATYPNDGIGHQAIHMVLYDYSDAGFNNECKS